MAVTLEPLPPAEAIAALERRGRRLDPTFAWQDAWQTDHAAMFTVAKSAGFDILNDVFDAFQKALKEGRTGRRFAAELTPVLQAKGWWGRQDVVDPATGETVSAQLGSPRRLKTIFNVNMRVSYAAGHWASFERNKAARPYLRYVAILDERTRPEHRARHNLCLPVDHPYWDIWAPPCGWSCRCTLQSLSERDVQRMRGQLKFEPPPDVFRDWVNKRTGEVSRVPAGIDPGWAYNPGKAGHQLGLAAAAKLIAAPPAIAAAAAEDPAWLARPLAKEFEDWFDQAAAGGRVDRSMVAVGALDAQVLDALKTKGIEPQSAAITLSQDVVVHMLRTVKAQRGQTVPAALLRTMPVLLKQTKAVLRDTRDNAILYVFDVPGEPRFGKLVVRLDFASKVKDPTSGSRVTIMTNAIRTAGLVPQITLADPAAYELITGSL